MNPSPKCMAPHSALSGRLLEYTPGMRCGSRDKSPDYGPGGGGQGGDGLGSPKAVQGRGKKTPGKSTGSCKLRPSMSRPTAAGRILSCGLRETEGRNPVWQPGMALSWPRTDVMALFQSPLGVAWAIAKTPSSMRAFRLEARSQVSSCPVEAPPTP